MMTAMSVSMPVSFPYNWTPDVHDRIWPEIWCPGVNHLSPQAIDCQFALPLWERAGNFVQDVINGYRGTVVRRDNLASDGHTDDELMWAWVDFNADIGGPVVQGIGPIPFGQQTYDLSEGCTVSFWGERVVISGGGNQFFVFACDNFKVYFETSVVTGNSAITFRCSDASSGVISWSWNLGSTIDLWNQQFFTHYAIVMQPYSEPAIAGTLVGTGEYDAGGGFTNNYQIITHAPSVYYHGFCSFTLPVEQNQILGTVTLTLPGGGVGIEYPTRVRVRAVDDGNSHLPVNISEAVSQFSTLTSYNVTFDPTSNAYTAVLDVTNIVQAVVNKYNWSPGNQVVFYLDTPQTYSGGHYISQSPTLVVNAITSGTKIGLYINGIHQDGDFVSQTQFPATDSGTAVFLADTSLSSTVKSYAGQIKDFRIYNAPLTAGDILDVFRVPEELYSQPVPIVKTMGMPNTYNITGSGGVLGAGQSTTKYVANPTASGGVYANGVAVSSVGSYVRCTVNCVSDVPSIAAGCIRVVSASTVNCVSNVPAIAPTYIRGMSATANAISDTSITAKRIQRATAQANAVSNVPSISATYTANGKSIVNAVSNVPSIAATYVTGSTCVANCVSNVPAINATVKAPTLVTCTVNCVSATSVRAGYLQQVSSTANAISDTTVTARRVQRAIAQANAVSATTVTANVISKVTAKADCRSNTSIAATYTAAATAQADCISHATITANVIDLGIPVVVTCAVNCVSDSSIDASRIRNVSAKANAVSATTITANRIASATSEANAVSTVPAIKTTYAEFVTSQVDCVSDVVINARSKQRVTMRADCISDVQPIDYHPMKNVSATANCMSDCTVVASVIYAATSTINCVSTVVVDASQIAQATIEANCVSDSRVDAIYVPRQLTQDLAAWLEPQLGGLLLYPVVLPQHPVLPAIVYYRPETSFEYYINGKPTRLRETTVRFEIFARSENEVIAISNTLTDVLHGFAGPIGSVIVSASQVDDVEDAEFMEQGRSTQGIIRTVDFWMQHNHRTDVKPWRFSTDAELTSLLDDVADIVATYSPNIADARPIILINKTGPGQDRYLNSDNTFNLKNYSLTIQAKNYKTCLETAEMLRLGLGAAVDNEYDSWDWNTQKKPIFETNIDLISI